MTSELPQASSESHSMVQRQLVLPEQQRHVVPLGQLLQEAPPAPPLELPAADVPPEEVPPLDVPPRPALPPLCEPP
jgi:hypothetical protein